jgi:hypothetical protein
MHIAKELAGWAFFAFTALCIGSIAHVGLLGGV